jgi:beta-aspartyl-peptidase (threonine type)
LKTTAIFFGVALAMGARQAMAETGGPCATNERFALVLHGGTREEREEDRGRTAFVRQVLTEGAAELRAGAPSLDVVERTVKKLEDSALFNAGRGSNANAGGFAEVDAGIADGATRRIGSVASMRGIKNAVAAARLVMEKSPHVFMVGDRGEAYVKSLGAEAVPPAYFIKNKQVNPNDPPHGTVGAVALDRCGHISAATSTGGFGAKIPGRVGDSPVFGAGFYADDQVGFSSTGKGEDFIRYTVPRDVAARIRYRGDSLRKAADSVIVDELGAKGIEAGLIGLDLSGQVLMTWSAAGMTRGYVTDKQDPQAFIFEGSRGDAR